jgi:hypothetical protein
MWKEEVVVQFKVLLRHLCRDTEKDHEKSSQDRWSQGRDLNLGPPEHEAATFSFAMSVINLCDPKQLNNLIT